LSLLFGGGQVVPWDDLLGIAHHVGGARGYCDPSLVCARESPSFCSLGIGTAGNKTPWAVVRLSLGPYSSCLSLSLTSDYSLAPHSSFLSLPLSLPLPPATKALCADTMFSPSSGHLGLAWEAAVVSVFSESFIILFLR